jgi:hypothetical protein
MKKFIEEQIANNDEELAPETLENLSNNKGDED